MALSLLRGGTVVQHVILGAGPAGVIAAETIRKYAPADSIVLVGDEPDPPYSRMAIPYLLMGHIREQGTHLRHGTDHFGRLRIELRRGRAKSVDVGGRKVVLDDGHAIAFDRLLIATGSSPATPPIPGIHAQGVHTCWTLKDARAIMARTRPGARVLQMGAGFIGCIILEALAAPKAVELTVVEMGDRMVPRMMGPTAGTMIKQWCEKKGVRVFTGTRVEAIEHGAGQGQGQGQGQGKGLLAKVATAVGLATETPDHGPLNVRLSNGQHVAADLVISATGVRPNIDFLENSPIKCLVGVLTDEHMQTTVPGIYAAGDCAEAFDKVSGKTIVSAIQPNAADQALVAAQNMVGRAAALRGVTQINVLDTLGLVSTSFGNWQGVPGGQHVELTEPQANRHLSLQFAGDVMVGCNSVGWTEHVGVMRGLVEGQVRLGGWKDKLLHDPTLLMEAYLATAQGQAQRAHIPAH
jgi:NADPH-dependent 2,4-dienoyl-CoA reductase/sulfur reductase-like enzyme